MPPQSMATKQYERHYVQHNYNDHSQDTPSSEDEYKLLMSSSQTDTENNYEPLPDTQKAAFRKCGPATKFPVKLHELLENAEVYGFCDVVSWKIHGRAFSVHNVQEFSKSIMPLYFNQSKITSFFRQLNLYGFKRITQGHDKGAYYHELFLHGKQFLTSRILRLKVKGTKVKGLPNPETEPNFYSMPYVTDASSFPALPVSALPTFGPGELLLPKSSFDLLSDITTLSDDEATVGERASHDNQKNKSFSHDEDDLNAIFCGRNVYEFSVPNFLRENLGPLLQQQENSFASLYAASDFTLNDTWAADDTLLLDDELDDSLQHYSLEECCVLRAILQDTIE
jgi:hypothetical protein